MTTRLSARGLVFIPSEVRKQIGLREGDDLIILCSATGDILLRPVRRGRRKNLFEALRAFKGLKITPRSKELVRSIKL